jgi:regulator-associated protein of mTOR
MTAVALQQQSSHRQQYNPRQSPHSSNGPSPGQSRPQSYNSNGSVQMRQDAALPSNLNGNASSVMNPRPAVSNDPVQVVNGNGAHASDTERSNASSMRPSQESARDQRRSSLQIRPTSSYTESSQEESEVDRKKRRPKALLQRSKSDFGPGGEARVAAEEEIPDWGARHGFEDHYASEEYVSQLANVSCTFPFGYRTLFRFGAQGTSFVTFCLSIAVVLDIVCIHIKLYSLRSSWISVLVSNSSTPGMMS